MQDETFILFLKMFVNYVCDRQKPILLTLDGHGSHLTYEAAQFCAENEIIMLCLPPNTSHALQPLDQGVFRQLKVKWKAILKQWFQESCLQKVDKLVFPVLLKKLCSELRPGWAVGGFKGSGLYPVNKETVKT